MLLNLISRKTVGKLCAMYIFVVVAISIRNGIKSPLSEQ